MKKFVFTLEAYSKYKETLKRKQRSELEEAQLRLRKLRAEEHRLKQAFGRYGDSLLKTIAEKENTVYMLEKHSDYFKFLQESKEILVQKINKAVIEENRRREVLIGTMRELKTLDNLREDQLLRYLEEVRRDEAKEMNDIISARTIAKQAEEYGVLNS